MDNLFFIVFILGASSIFLISIFNEVEVKQLEELEHLELNQRVRIEGEVIEQRRIFEGTSLIILENRIELVCSCTQDLKGKRIKARGLIEEYNHMKQIKVLELYF